jgi:hypothetical protein
METRGIVHIFGGGTFIDVAPHLSLAARGTGKTALQIRDEFYHGSHNPLDGYSIQVHLTRQGDPLSKLVTPDDVSKKLDEVLADPLTKIIFMSCAMVDFDGKVMGGHFTDNFGQRKTRLRTDEGTKTMTLEPLPKVIQKIRKTRKDVFLVGFKQTFGRTPDEQYLEGLKLLKKSSCNLVLANDGETKLNMVITPEQARYHETTDRIEALHGLIEMTVLRHINGTFTRSTVVEGGASVSWESQDVPESLRRVVDHCRMEGAYKPFLGSTVGHFAVNIGNGRFLTSIRKSNFNDLYKTGLVLVEAKDNNQVKAYGFKPSVGGQSQRIIFREHPGADCIVHFHCPKKPGSVVPEASQRPYECGSHQCGRNTSQGLKAFDLPSGRIYAVMLDKHGPNIVFPKNINADDVIKFIDDNFNLKGRTDNLTIEVPAAMRLPAPVLASL